MCEAEDQLYDLQRDFRRLEEELAERERLAVGEEPDGLRVALVRSGLVSQGEAYPPGDYETPWPKLSVLALERAIEAMQQRRTG